MLKNLLEYFNKYYIFLSLFSIFLANLFVIDNLPFGDDYAFVFDNHAFKYLENPFSFFVPWNSNFKSWGFTYFILWGFYKVFGEQFVIYRVFNLILHFLNHLLLRKILQKKFEYSQTRINLISLLFLFNPLSILTTSWIFQIKTTLSVFFILIFLMILYFKDLNSFKNQLKLAIIFWFSLVSKVTGILLPVYVLLFLRQRYTRLTRIKILVPLFLIAGFYGALNIKGITHNILEVSYLKKNILTSKMDMTIKRSQVIEEVNQASNADENGFNPEINSISELKEGTEDYFGPLFSADKFKTKYIISMQNIGRFFLSSVGLNRYLPFYEENIETITSKMLYLYVAIGLTAIMVYLKTKSHALLLSLVLITPISGIFYIPYMKFSYTSDHWFYPAIIGSTLMIAYWLKNQKALIALLCSILGNYAFTIYNYKSFPHLLMVNYKAYPNKVILEHQSHYDRIHKRWNKIASDYDFLTMNKDYYNPVYGKVIFKSAKRTKNLVLIDKYYSRNAVQALQTHDIDTIKRYVLEHHGMFDAKTLDLTESLNAIFTHKIENDIYHKAITHLE